MIRAGLRPTKTTLGNGVVTIVKETHKTPIVAFNLSVAAGSICDPEEAPGAISLLSRVIDRGTTTRSASDIAEELDSRGVSLSVLVTRHLFALVCSCLAGDFDRMFTLLGDIVMNPSVPEDELATRKKEAVTAIRQDEDNPFVRAGERLMEALYGAGHPYGRKAKGTVESIERMSRETLLALHRRRFAPGELTAVIVGDVAEEAVHETANRIFGSWRQAAPPAIVVPRPTPAGSRSRLVMPMMNKAQADIAYGFTTIARSDPQYYAYSLMNNALGQYAVGGRLGDSIRERQGMAYYVGSSFDANVIEGPLVVRAGVNPANVDACVASIDEELSRVRLEGLTARELDESRQYLVGSMPRSLETNAGIAHFLQVSQFFGLGLDHDVQLPELLAAVTLEQANAAARQAVDPARATIVVAGPYEEKP